MQACALTMVYRNYWALGQWYRHYGEMLGPERLYIIAHGADPEIKEICPDAQIWTIPRETIHNFDRRREHMLNACLNALGETYDWVVRTDADELICLDPGIHPSLSSLLNKAQTPALFAVGLNLIEAAEDPELGPNAPVLRHRRHALFSGQYSKAWIGKKGTQLLAHGVRDKPGKPGTYKYDLPLGVFLIHLKYANLAVLEADNDVRQAVVRQAKGKLPGYAWQHADAHSRTYLEKFKARPERDWTEAVPQARAALIETHTRGNRGLIQSSWYDPEYRVVLPNWFGGPSGP